MELRDAKQRFFALRNGLLADTLREQAADGHRLIFGLNLPQLMQIATEAGQDATLADSLWADSDCRESRLLAPMVCPRTESRLHWLDEVTSVEEADILCHRLLRHQPGAKEKAMATAKSEVPLMKYAALRLLLNLMPESSPEAVHLAQSAVNNPLTAGVAHQILDYYC